LRAIAGKRLPVQVSRLPVGPGRGSRKCQEAPSVHAGREDAESVQRGVC
jgi:hypothetical protein